MGMWTERARSWRKTKKRAVSPIIATILLVAITVVLAAVLYILISGLTKGPGNVPLGTAFAWGPASNVTAASGPAAGCTAAKECYSLEVGSAGSGITGNGISFTVRSSTGAVISVTGWTFTLVSVAGSALTATWTASGTCAGAACTQALVSGEVIALNTGATASLLGDNVIAVGQGSFQGEVSTVGGLPA
jgi:archaeal type IV pilus assembly protein PilA